MKAYVVVLSSKRVSRIVLGVAIFKRDNECVVPDIVQIPKSVDKPK